jgi:hypothetical protein
MRSDFAAPRTGGQQRSNPNQYGWGLHALLVAMEPPVIRLATGELRQIVRWGRLAGDAAGAMSQP